MWNSQGIFFIWSRVYSEIFKSALMYFNPIQYLNVYADSCVTDFIKTALIFNWDQWRMRRNDFKIHLNHLNTLKIYLFSPTTKQPLSNFEPWKSWKYTQLLRLGPDPSCLK